MPTHKSRVRVTVATEVTVELVVEHENGDSATDLTVEEKRRAIFFSGLPGRPTVVRVGYLGRMDEP